MQQLNGLLGFLTFNQPNAVLIKRLRVRGVALLLLEGNGSLGSFSQCADFQVTVVEKSEVSCDVWHSMLLDYGCGARIRN